MHRGGARHKSCSPLVVLAWVLTVDFAAAAEVDLMVLAAAAEQAAEAVQQAA